MNSGRQPLQSGFLALNTQDNNLGAMKSSSVADNSAGILQHNHSHTGGRGRAAPPLISLLRIVTQCLAEIEADYTCGLSQITD